MCARHLVYGPIQPVSSEHRTGAVPLPFDDLAETRKDYRIERKLSIAKDCGCLQQRGTVCRALLVSHRKVAGMWPKKAGAGDEVLTLWSWKEKRNFPGYVKPKPSTIH